MDLKIQYGITLCWGTLVFVFNMPDHAAVNAKLKPLILDYKSKSPGIYKSNFGGWHSTDDLLNWPSPAVTTLRDWIVEGFRRVTKRTGNGKT